MNVIELTELFLQYKKTQDLLADLESKIQTEVLRLGDTQKIAGVKATYYGESIEYDYESAAKAANPSQEIVESYSTQKFVTRWKEVCQAVNANLENFQAVKEARVVVK